LGGKKGKKSHIKSSGVNVTAEKSGSAVRLLSGTRIKGEGGIKGKGVVSGVREN